MEVQIEPFSMITLRYQSMQILGEKEEAMWCEIIDTRLQLGNQVVSLE